MRTNFVIAALVYPMVQAVLFGVALIGLLATGAPHHLFPAMIAASFLVSAPIALTIAPRLRSRAWRQGRRPEGGVWAAAPLGR